MNEPGSPKVIPIPSIHPKLDLAHLNVNGKLFTDAQIAAVKTLPDLQGRISKKKLNELFQAEIANGSLTPFNFSLIKTGDEYQAIYKGKDHSLGSGAFGSVKILQNLQTGETSEVLKVIDRSRAEITAIEVEKKGLEKTNQFHALYERQDKPNQFEFVMTMARGCSLEAFVREKELPTVAWIDMAIQILMETQKLHAQGILHCDIKPANAYYDVVNKKATLLDMGLATYLPDAQSIVEGATIERRKGTAYFMSPTAEKGINNESTDSYALAITIADVMGLMEKTYLPHRARLTDSYSSMRLATENDRYYIENTKIPDEMTRAAILKILTAMTQENSNPLHHVPNAIAAFQKIREEYIETPDLTKKIAYLNIADYINANASDRVRMENALQNVTEVWLLDNNGAHSSQYLTVQRELLKQDLNVVNSVVQHSGNDMDTVMRDYARSRELSERNIYDCSYLTNTGQLASLHDNLNEAQLNKIVGSLTAEAMRLGQKYGAQAEPYKNSINLTLSTIKNGSTFDQVLRNLDQLQTSMLHEQETKKNIIQLMKDIEKLSAPAPVPNAKGFDAVYIHRALMQRELVSKSVLALKPLPPIIKQPPPLPTQTKQPPPLPPGVNRTPPPLPTQTKQPPPLPSQTKQPPPLPPGVNRTPPPLPTQTKQPPPLPSTNTTEPTETNPVTPRRNR
jgi:serine/threonine protein kinase